MEGLLEGEDNLFYSMSYMRLLTAENTPYQFQAARNEYNGHIEINDNILDMETNIIDLPHINEHHVALTETEERPCCLIVGKEFKSEEVCGSILYPPLAEAKNFLAADANTNTRFIQVVEHEPSAILFRDFSLDTSIPKTIIHDILNDETSEEKEFYDEDEEEEADENGDIFTDLPQYESMFPGLRRSQCHPISPNDKIIFNFEDVCQLLSGTQSGVEQTLNEGERNNLMEERIRWSESMTCLMMKLEQLNVDIEEAVMAGASQLHLIPTDCCTQLANSSMTDRRSPELEAKEACDWLRAAGFPQYAQLYEDSQFPIDIASVKRDHDFLDRDHVEPLCRRLKTLNKCASMKLDVSFQRKKSEDSDEEDLCAISDKWRFQRLSRQWSRVDDIDSLFGRSERLGSSGEMKNTTSSESVLTDLSEPEICSIHSGSSGGSDCRCSYVGNSASRETFECADTMCIYDSNPMTILPPWPKDCPDGKLNAKNEKPAYTKTKTFLKCMGTLRSKGTYGKSKGLQRTGAIIISEPILQLEPDPLKTIPQLKPDPLKTMSCVGNGQVKDSAMNFTATGNLDVVPEIKASTESTPCLKETPAPEPNKRGGMYLEDIDVFTALGTSKAGHNHNHNSHSQEDLVVHIPKDHKPGTFPKALSIESLSPTENFYGVNWRSGGISLSRQKGIRAKEPRIMSSRCSRGSRLSVYDNVPGSHLYASTGDLMDLERDDLFPHLDDVLQHINGLQQSVYHWSKDIMPDLQDDDLSVGESGNSNSPNPMSLDFEGNSISDGRTTPSDMERDAASLNESDTTGTRERRDSGVGASLTRTNRRLRWSSFQISHQQSGSVASLQISNQSAGQLNLLQKFSLLRLTAIMEKYSLSNKHGWTWSVPKFMKRMKGPDYKDKNIFGVPLMVHVQRTGQPLPQSIQQALRFLRSHCLDQVGLFRKSGVKSRIQALRQMNETSPENVSYEDQCAYDVADMMKQFFRDLPEPLLTSKLGETFLHIYQYVPKDQRLQAVQSAIMLMSDENREVLQTLLCFLSDVTSVEENQMTPMNLAVCLAPSLFHLNLLKKDNSPRAIQKKYATGRPDQKDLNENFAATQGLAHMIMECNRLFEIPHEVIAQSRNSYVEADVHVQTMEELGKQLEEEGGNVNTYFESTIQGLQKEAKEKFKGWISLSSTENTDLAYKKVGDENPLRAWKVSVEVEAPPSVVLNRILSERQLWDDDFVQSKVVETLDNQTEVYQYVLNSMAPHPSRDFVVLRSWRTDLPKGICTLAAISVEHDEANLIGGVRAAVLDTRYLIEPCGSGKSKLTYICRVDLKGHCPEWYNKCFGHLCASEALRIRNSFQPISAEGPEAKI